MKLSPKRNSNSWRVKPWRNEIKVTVSTLLESEQIYQWVYNFKRFTLRTILTLLQRIGIVIWLLVIPRSCRLIDLERLKHDEEKS